MNKKLSLGFYSLLISRLFYTATLVIFLCFSYFTVNRYYNNCVNIVHQQTTLFNEEWNSKVDFLSDTLKDVFLPRIIKSINNSPLNREKKLLNRFKAIAGSNSAIEDIFILNPEFEVINSANNSNNDFKNISLADRDYIKRSHDNPSDIQYGDPIIGKINGKLSLPISIAILHNGRIEGYIVVSINLESLSNNFISNKISNSIERISFSDENIPQSNNKTKLEDLNSHGIYAFIKLLLRSSSDRYLIVEMNSDNNHPKVLFVYNIQNITDEFLKSYIIGLSLLLLIASVFASISWLYKKYILEPISKVYETQQNILKRYNSISNEKIEILDDFSKSEIGNIRKLDEVGNLIINKLENDHYATKLALEYNRIALEHLNIKSLELNESIEDIVDEFKNSSFNNSSKDLLNHLANLYNLGSSKVYLIEVYKRLEKEILPTITEGKVLVDISEEIEQIVSKASCPKFDIKIVDDANGDGKLHSILLYKSPFNNTIHNIIKYIKQCYSKKGSNVEILLQNSKNNKNVIITFAITPNQCSNIIGQIDASLTLLEEAKIYSLFNCSMFTTEYGANLHKISVIIPFSEESNTRISAIQSL